MSRLRGLRVPERSGPYLSGARPADQKLCYVPAGRDAAEPDDRQLYSVRSLIDHAQRDRLDRRP